MSPSSAEGSHSTGKCIARIDAISSRLRASRRSGSGTESARSMTTGRYLGKARRDGPLFGDRSSPFDLASRTKPRSVDCGIAKCVTALRRTENRVPG